MPCVTTIEWDRSGHWHVFWGCGESMYGVSDYDLASALRRHKCDKAEKEPNG